MGEDRPVAVQEMVMGALSSGLVRLVRDAVVATARGRLGLAGPVCVQERVLGELQRIVPPVRVLVGDRVRVGLGGCAWVGAPMPRMW